MPAMRISVLAIALAAIGPNLGAAAHAEDVAAKPEQIREAELSPLAPNDTRIDALYEKLRKERSPESARSLADQIRETSTFSGSATVDMLMTNAGKAIDEKRYAAALDFLDQVTLVAPDYAEGWNRRAALHFLMGNYGKSMSDTARTLSLEPRHLGALSGLAGILEDTGHDQQALKAWETYLSHYPADRDAQKEALDLYNKLTGQKT
jgi:tetratricopeptide (TPR) repeat protein